MRRSSSVDAGANCWRDARKVGLILAFVTCTPLAAEPASRSLQPEETAQARPLPAVDALLYRRIFERIELGDLSATAPFVAAIEDRRLLPDVEARLLLASGASAPWARWSDWLARNREHPLAPQLHRRAQGLRPANATLPAAPPPSPPLFGYGDEDVSWRGRSVGDGWSAGLAAWRAGRHQEALTQFERAARTPDLSAWGVAGAAFWAGRAAQALGDPARAARWFERAAETPQSFYGLLARRHLGLDSGFDWTRPEPTPAELRDWLAQPGGERALLLAQIGRGAAVEEALRQLVSRLPDSLLPMAAIVAERAGAPSLAMRLAQRVEKQTGQRIDVALYPLLPWSPQTGYRVNRAMLASIARIESGFHPQARNSKSGATGLMQLMPSTARAMGAQAGLPATDRHLIDPSANLGLAQEYLDLLLGHERIRGNLLHMAVAYNLGVAGMGRVQERISGPDPLLAMEMLPSVENRLFAQRVLATFWIYQMRLGQPTESLDELAQGRWPIYGVDEDRGELAQYHDRK